MTKSQNKVFTYSGLFGVGVVYLVLLIILVTVFAIAHFDVAIFVALLCVLTGICALLAVMIYLISRRVAQVDQRTEEKFKKGNFEKPKRGGF